MWFASGPGSRYGGLLVIVFPVAVFCISLHINAQSAPPEPIEATPSRQPHFTPAPPHALHNMGRRSGREVGSGIPRDRIFKVSALLHRDPISDVTQNFLPVICQGCHTCAAAAETPKVPRGALIDQLSRTTRAPQLARPAPTAAGRSGPPNTAKRHPISSRQHHQKARTTRENNRLPVGLT